MRRYHYAASCTGAVNNTRNSGRTDSSSLSTNFSINSRQGSPLVPYKSKCEKELLNSRLGPPDFHSQGANCPEETLTKEYVQSGYRETVEGLKEAKEIHVTQVNTFTKAVVLKCKEAIRKRVRAISESRAKKQKAGQAYGAPLSVNLLSKPIVFPELKSCGEDFKKKWIEKIPSPRTFEMVFETPVDIELPRVRVTSRMVDTELGEEGYSLYQEINAILSRPTNSN